MSALKVESSVASPVSSDLSSPREKRPPVLRGKSKRPQLSCNACRTRKVKCDRVQPCTACSLHQQAISCQYDLTESERRPILQAEALKEKSKEILHLRQEIQQLKGQSIKANRLLEADARRRGTRRSDAPSKGLRKGSRPRLLEPRNTIPVETAFPEAPKIEEMVEEGTILAHSILNERDNFSAQMNSIYPFPTLWPAQSGVSGLVDPLPGKQDFIPLLKAFEQSVQPFFFPYVPDGCTATEVDLFLSNIEHNSHVYPDRLARLFASLACGVQCVSLELPDETRETLAMQQKTKKGDVYVAAAMQALRIGSFLSRPTLAVIETLLMIGSYLTNTGRSLDASSIFGTTVRLAQAIGLHRDPSRIRPLVPPPEIGVRRRIWWWMLQVDQQYSTILGRPLAISTIGDCPAPSETSEGVPINGLQSLNAELTLVCRQVLSIINLTKQQIGDLTAHLMEIQNKLPEPMGFRSDHLASEEVPPSWSIDVQAAMIHCQLHHILILMNRGREDNRHDENSYASNSSFKASEHFLHAPLNGQERVLESCRSILHIFEHFHGHVYILTICWSVVHQVLNAAWILIQSSIQTENVQDTMMARKAYQACVRIPILGLNNPVGEIVAKLGGLLGELAVMDKMAGAPQGQREVELRSSTSSRVKRPIAILQADPCRTPTNAAPQAEQVYRASQPTKRLIEKKPYGSQAKGSKSATKTKRNQVLLPEGKTIKLNSQQQKQSEKSSWVSRSADLEPLVTTNTIMDIDTPHANSPWSVHARQSLASTITPTESSTTPESSGFYTSSPFESSPGTPRNGYLNSIMVPHQIFAAAGHDAGALSGAVDMCRSFSESFSEQPSSPFNISQPAVQFPSPLQAQGSPDWHPPGQALQQSHPHPILQPQYLARNDYTCNLYNLSPGNLQASEAIPTFQDAHTAVYDWQMHSPGFGGLI